MTLQTELLYLFPRKDLTVSAPPPYENILLYLCKTEAANILHGTVHYARGSMLNVVSSVHLQCVVKCFVFTVHRSVFSVCCVQCSVFNENGVQYTIFCVLCNV